MRKLVIYNIILMSVVLLTIIGFIGISYYNSKTAVSESQSSGGSSSIPSQPVIYEPATEEDYQRLEEILPQNEIIQKLPDNAKIILKFYNFDTGERSWEKSYILTKGNAEQGSANDADMDLIMHSKYLSKLTASNFCNIIKSAKANGDFASDLKISKTSLLWKYKSIMSYRDCLGL
jgi:hypothetical protein